MKGLHTVHPGMNPDIHDAMIALLCDYTEMYFRVGQTRDPSTLLQYDFGENLTDRGWYSLRENDIQTWANRIRQQGHYSTRQIENATRILGSKGRIIYAS